MKALHLSQGTLTFTTDYPMPTPAPGEALIRVLVAGICHTDLELVRGYHGFEGVPGHEFVGRVEACPEQPSLLGQRVAGEINISCGHCSRCRAGLRTHCHNRRVLGILHKDGAFAEYLTLPVENLHPIPDTITNSEAAFVEPLAACFEILEQTQIQPTASILVLGDGKLGLLAAQVLALTGADVTLQGRHKAKLAIADGFHIKTRLAGSEDRTSAEQEYDLVVETTGSVAGLEVARQLTRPRGTIILKTTVVDQATIDLAPFVVNEITIIGSRCGPFEPAIRALEHQQVAIAPLLSATYPLDNAIEAIARAGERGILKVQIVP